MSVEKMQKLINSIAQMVDNNEKIAVPVLSAKLNRLADSNPYDQTIVMAADVVSKLSGRAMFMTKAELVTLYNKLHTRNTKFAEFFQEEMGQGTELATPTFAPAHEKPLEGLFDVGDTVLSNALASAFDKTVPLKLYSKANAEKAKRAVSSNLDAWNLKASRVEVQSGNENFIVVKADYDTPKGITSILVPVEVNKDKALELSVFMGNAGPQDLNHVNIKQYITQFAGSTLKVRAEDVVDVLTNAITTKTEVSGAELALTKLNSTRGTVGSASGVVGLTVTASPKNVVVDLPKSKSTDSFAAKFENGVGFANFKFGPEKVAVGRDLVARTAGYCGLTNHQVSVIDCDENTIYYAVSASAGRTAFKVPVKFANNKAMSPDIIVCNGSIYAFDKANVSKLLARSEADHKVAAVASPQYGLKASELVDNVRAAMDEGNFSKAEDALNILQQEGDPTSYRVAFSLYVNGLSMTKTASQESTCSMIVKSASSKHPTCGHTGLPVQKVYQDQHGNCQPLYRRGMSDAPNTGFFMNYKIFG